MKDFYDEYVKSDKVDLRKGKKNNAPELSLKEFLFSGMDLLKSFGYILLSFLWILMLAYKSGSPSKDDFLYLSILGILLVLPSLISIIKWSVLIIITHPTGQMSRDYNISRRFFKSSVAVGKEYLFLSEPHKVVIIEECGDVDVEKLQNEAQKWLVFSVYTVKKKRPIQFTADFAPVKKDYFAFEKAMIEGNAKLESVMPRVRDKLRRLGVLEPVLEERKKLDTEIRLPDIKMPEINVGGAVKKGTFNTVTINSLDFKEGISYFNGNLVLGKKHMYIKNTGSSIDYQKVIHVMIEEKSTGYSFSVIVEGKTNMPTFTTKHYDGISKDIKSIETELLTRCKKLKKDSFKILKYDK